MFLNTDNTLYRVFQGGTKLLITSKTDVEATLVSKRETKTITIVGLSKRSNEAHESCINFPK